jgi:hypothetical protein
MSILTSCHRHGKPLTGTGQQNLEECSDESVPLDSEECEHATITSHWSSVRKWQKEWINKVLFVRNEELLFILGHKRYSDDGKEGTY